jgi:hypothetical protein
MARTLTVYSAGLRMVFVPSRDKFKLMVLKTLEFRVDGLGLGSRLECLAFSF